ncbi:Thaumatin-like protein 1 [Linum grandiflorum]
MAASLSYSTVFCCFLTLLVYVSAATFTLVNNCEYTVWPGILGTPKLDSTGFELPNGASISVQAPPGWSGRFWGRTGCNVDGAGKITCTTADCGSGQIECNGAGANPPATLAEFTLGSGSPDFYDVSLVDGYNLPMIVEATGGSGDCALAGCIMDINQRCPSALKVDGGYGCRSACEAFGNPEYCCNGAYSTPETCRRSIYSQIFKSMCPFSYTYAYDDASSTFTCIAADYVITFCPTPRLPKSVQLGNVSVGSTMSQPAIGRPKKNSAPIVGPGFCTYVLYLFFVFFFMILTN